MIEYIFIGVAAFIIAAVLISQTVRRCAYRKRASRINERITQILARERVGGS